MFFANSEQLLRRILLSGLQVVLLAGCSPEEPDAQGIIDSAIQRHGGAAYDGSEIAFVFRGDRYVVRHEGSRYRYERTRTDSTGVWVDVLTPRDLDRTLNGGTVALAERESLAASSTMNSVPYFVLLPFRLNDPAVRKRYLARGTIKGEPYYKIEVTFAQTGGGRDWEDRYVYWIHTRDHTMDYLAYRFGAGGRDTRFREAVRAREVEGIRFADYRNYLVDSLDFDIAQYDRLFEDGGLEWLSDVSIDSIRVSR